MQSLVPRSTARSLAAEVTHAKGTEGRLHRCRTSSCELAASFPEGMRVLRVYHGGRDPGHPSRDRALPPGGVKLSRCVPSLWPDGTGPEGLQAEPFPVYELEVARVGDVNRH